MARPRKSQLSREILVERALALVPKIRGRAPECDAERQLPDSTRQDLRELGLARVLQPRLFGGAEAPFGGMVEVLNTVGSGCGSTAWALAQYIGHNFMVSQWPERAQREIWGQDEKALFAGILIPSLGKAKKVRGGYELTGRWPFVSGVTACDWCILSGMVEKTEGPSEERYFLARKDQLNILDTWNTMGLIGSGSHDVEVESLFFPSHLTLPIKHLKGGESPGRKIHRAPMYRSPSYMTFGLLISSASVGIAVGMVRDYVKLAKTQVALMSGKKALSEATNQIRISRATVTVEAAQALLHQNCREIMNLLETDKKLPSNEKRTKFRAAGAMAGTLALEAGNLIWDAGGGRGVYLNNPLARAYRDLCAATRHMTHSWDLNGVTHGSVRLGLPLQNPSL